MGWNQFIGSKTVNITSPNPEGSFDKVKDEGGSIFVRGWAFDPNDKTKQLEIHVYIGDPENGGELHSITADTERKDVDEVYSCGKYHGFNSSINTDKRGTYKIYVFFNFFQHHIYKNNC